ncbi:MAG: cobalamin-dependent protein [Pseudonocardiales bacterium]|nr:cobalamin-dependent protein [Hyphomicrobiales bacterium]MBV9429447.1 cobalamin-dependent protein [Bradyrhizobiaceae bacterium]MBV9728115.1 cobalamin-dependent protein [Pseudonocardiales bacterium]
MTESDCHTVSIYLFKLFLEEHGFDVLNLGACVSLDTMFASATKFSADAIVFGAQNGHAYDDLIDLKLYKQKYRLSCPIFLGGNVAVGAEKADHIIEAIKDLGVDYIVHGFDEFLAIAATLSRPAAEGERERHRDRYPSPPDAKAPAAHPHIRQRRRLTASRASVTRAAGRGGSGPAFRENLASGPLPDQAR